MRRQITRAPIPIRFHALRAPSRRKVRVRLNTEHQTPEHRHFQFGRVRSLYSVLWLLAACLALGVAAQQAGRRELVGQLLNVRGTVTVERNGKSKSAQTCDPLRVDDVVSVGAKASAQALFSVGGTRYALPSGSKTQIKSGELKTLSGASATMMPKINKGLAVHARAGRFGAQLVRGSGDAGPGHPAPVGAVPAQPLTLHWSGLTEGSLTVRIKEADSDMTALSVKVPAPARTFTVPVGTLKPGLWYAWSVNAEDGHSCEALIRLSMPEDAARITAIEREAAAGRQANPGDPTPDLLLAQGYEDLGLLDKALAAYAAALKLSPDDAGIKKAADNLNQWTQQR